MANADQHTRKRNRNRADWRKDGRMSECTLHGSAECVADDVIFFTCEKCERLLCQGHGAADKYYYFCDDCVMEYGDILLMELT